MLILQRRANESIVIEKDGKVYATILVTQVGSGSVRLGLVLPKDHKILRHELLEKEKS